MLFSHFKKFRNDDDDGDKRTINKDRLAIQKALAILEQEGDANEEENETSEKDFIDCEMKMLRHNTGSFLLSRSSQQTLKSKQNIHATSNNKNKQDTRHIHLTQFVHFSNHDQFIYIPHIIDIPQEEIDQCWMKKEDYSFIRSRSLRLVEMMEDTKQCYPISPDTNTMIVDTHLVCVRGLERKTSQRANERGQLQRKLETSVFSLQKKQKEEGLVDPEAIKKVCEKYSKKSSKIARLVGISDEINASVRPGIPYNNVIPPLRKRTVTSSAA